MVDIEQRCLRALEQDRFALLEHVVEQKRTLADVRAETLCVGAELVPQLVDRVGGQIEELLELRIDAIECDAAAFAEDALIEQVLHAQTDACHLILVARADAPLGGADVVLAQALLERTVEIAVIGHDDMSVAGDLEILGRNALVLEHIDLFDEHLGVDDHAVANDRRDVLVHDARRDEVQAELLVTAYDGMAGVVAALVAHNTIELGRYEVANLTFAFVSPLGSHQYRGRHAYLLTSSCTWTHEPYAVGDTTLLL